MFSRLQALQQLKSDPVFSKIENRVQTCDLSDYATDFGGMIKKTPQAIFKPTDNDELKIFLSLINKYQIKIAIRGNANSAFGQAQIKNGILIDLSEMNLPITINENNTHITVPAFRTWFDAIEETKKINSTVPVTIDNLKLTIGGTLSFGALGGTSHRLGSGCDNIEELSVMTLDGNIHTCSQLQHRELYDAALAGRGQFCIILSATIPLLKAKKYANTHFLAYDDANQFFQDQKTLYETQAIDHLKGFTRVKTGSNQWEYVIEVANYFDDSENPSSLELIKSLTPTSHTQTQVPYFDFINQVTQFVDALKASGSLDAPHPWYNILMPEETVHLHLAEILKGKFLTGQEPVIVYPMKSEHFKQPLFVKPESKTFYLIGVLYNTSFAAQKDFAYQEALAQNKAFYISAKKMGGCRYPVDAIQFTHEDWQNHYGSKWEHVVSLKAQLDPQNLLSKNNIMETQALKLETPTPN